MMNPRYPIYIPSKGRWQFGRRLTSRVLDVMNVPHYLVIEESEYDLYASVVDSGRLIVLNPEYQRTYDTCDDLGDSKPKGSGPARNFIWDHAQESGHERHWVIDDNIQWFDRLNRNSKIRVHDGTYFGIMEDFVDRYENVAIAGPHYDFFMPRRTKRPPFNLNSRIYSCILIQTDLPFRWRGRYNEDTILSLDMLKEEYCSILFNAYLQKKVWTQQTGGGNTDTVYLDGTLPKSQMIAQMHPDVCRVVWKYNRWHHHCDYRRFKANKLIRKPGIEIPEGVNEYGMKLVKMGQPYGSHGL